MGEQSNWHVVSSEPFEESRGCGRFTRSPYHAPPIEKTRQRPSGRHQRPSRPFRGRIRIEVSSRPLRGRIERDSLRLPYARRVVPDPVLTPAFPVFPSMDALMLGIAVGLVLVTVGLIHLCARLSERPR